MGELPTFDCAMCGEVTRGNTRPDEGAMLCRGCHLDFINARGDTLEAAVESLDYSTIRAQEIAADMRALFAVRTDQAALDAVCKAIRLRDGVDCR